MIEIRNNENCPQLSIKQQVSLCGWLPIKKQQIEKDYVLSWVLQGIARHEELTEAIAFMRLKAKLHLKDQPIKSVLLIKRTKL